MTQKLIYGVVLIILLLVTKEGRTQHMWDWHDPNDFGFIDLGDNKVIGYNLVGLGLALWIDNEGTRDSTLIKNVQVGRFHEYRRSPLSNIWMFEGRWGKSLRKYLSIGGGLRGYLTGGEGITTGGAGAFIWFSWYILNFDHWRLSYDNGVGPNYFFSAFPSGGTRFNFTTHYGLSLEILVHSRWLKFQLTNIHISNAGIKGKDRNPALDAIGIQIGYPF